MMKLKQPATIGLGTWKSATEDVYKAVYHALTHGYRHIDCAPIYMNEKPVGQAIHDSISSSGIQREDLWITSKLWNSFHAYNDAISALKETLHFMQLDYLDSFLIHWPVAMKKSVGHARAQSASDFISLKDITLEETWQALIDCQKLGLTRTIGVSNFSQSKIEAISLATGIKPFINQVECHPLLSQQPLLNYCQENNILFTAYSPLGSSDRPAPLKQANEPSLLQHPTINEIATQHNVSNANILLAWGLSRNTIVIPKSTQVAHIDSNLAASNIQLTHDNIMTINTLNQDFRFIDGRFFEKPGSPYNRETIWQ
jgi:alcohol dehydrogenase (NADP+)